MSITRYDTFACDDYDIEEAEGGMFVYYSDHIAELAAMQARAERAEHFARVVTGLRGSMSKSEVSLLVETAQITLLFPTEKAGDS